ncbi:MAG: ABC transporter permease [Mycobacteriales bacterium]
MSARSHAASGERLAIGGTVLAVVGLVVVPLVRLVRASAEAGGASLGRVLHSPGIATAAWHTVFLAAAVTAIAVPLGVALALLLRRADLPARGALRIAAVLPLVVPQFVLGYSWTQAYGRAGFTDTLLSLRWDGLTGPAGIIVVLVVNAAPVSFLLAGVGLATRAQPELERAARASGARPAAVLRTVTLPLLRPAIAAACVLIFVSTLESFAVPQILGTPAGFATLTTRIYADLALGSNPDAFTDAITLALGLVILAAVILIPADLVLAPRLRADRDGQPAGPVLPRRRTWRSWSVAAAVVGYVAVVIAVPTASLLAASVNRAVGLTPSPGNWTLDNFRLALDGTFGAALRNSLELAATAATVLVVLGAIVGVLERHRTGRILATVSTLSFVIPGSTLAVGLLIAYGNWLGGGLTLILLAYLAKLWALAHRPISGALDRFPGSEWSAARTSGARTAAAVRTVWIPAMAPALVGGWLLTFVTALHEVTMSSLLYGPDSQTLAVEVLNSQELGTVGRTAALSVVLTVLLIVPAVPAWVVLRLLRRDRPARNPIAPAPEVSVAR